MASVGANMEIAFLMEWLKLLIGVVTLLSFALNYMLAKYMLRGSGVTRDALIAGALSAMLSHRSDDDLAVFSTDVGSLGNYNYYVGTAVFAFVALSTGVTFCAAG